MQAFTSSEIYEFFSLYGRIIVAVLSGIAKQVLKQHEIDLKNERPVRAECRYSLPFCV